jgi:RNA polymerase sigma-70 factor (ECF subfamily)
LIFVTADELKKLCDRSIVQETFLRLFRRLGAKGREDNLQGWAFCVARNLAVSRHKYQSRFTTKSQRERAVLSDSITVRSPNPEEFLIGQEKIARVNQAITSLPSRQLQCVRLRTEGFRYRDIAETLEITMATVAESLCRASKKLREYFFARLVMKSRLKLLYR